MQNAERRMKNDQTGKPPPTTPSRAAARHSTFSIIHSSLGGEAAPAPATWRAQINQNLPTPRTTAISRKRHIYAMLKIISSILVVCLCIGGVYFLYMTWHDDPSDNKAPSGNQPLKNITLNPNSTGVLDHAWVVRALALPKNADMMQLNLAALRDRLLANPQIRVATLTRQFPDTLVVSLEERVPVARLLVRRNRALPSDEYLAAIDGTLYIGANYNPALLAALPYLADVPRRRDAPDASAYAPIEGMASVADLIATARANIPDLYANWRSISLKRYADDRVLIVNNAGNSQIIFGADPKRDNFLTQVARLDYIMDTLAATPHAPLRAIDLSVGDTPGGVQVPVTFYSTGANAANSTTTATSATITIRQR